MRVAAIYDIHGNLPALEAVLRDVRQVSVDMIVVGGDVLPGPFPKETLDCLLKLEWPTRFIHGNGESDVLATLDGKEIQHVPERFREVVTWSADQLDLVLRREVASWPSTFNLKDGGMRDVLFCHATPRNDTDIFTRLTKTEHLDRIFANIDTKLVVCGHTHMQFDRVIGDVRVINAGSVGMPFGNPGAYWLLLDDHDIELRRTDLDLDAAAVRVRATGYPHAEDFAERNILNPPPEADILELYARAELK